MKKTDNPKTSRTSITAATDALKAATTAMFLLFKEAGLYKSHGDVLKQYEQHFETIMSSHPILEADIQAYDSLFEDTSCPNPPTHVSTEASASPRIRLVSIEYVCNSNNPFLYTHQSHITLPNGRTQRTLVNISLLSMNLKNQISLKHTSYDKPKPITNALNSDFIKHNSKKVLNQLAIATWNWLVAILNVETDFSIEDFISGKPVSEKVNIIYENEVCKEEQCELITPLGKLRASRSISKQDLSVEGVTVDFQDDWPPCMFCNLWSCADYCD